MNPDFDAWSAQLERIAGQPLAMCEQFPVLARRHEAWWNGACLDRPVFLGTANYKSRRLDLLNKPDAWFAAKCADLNQLHRVGDTLPSIRVDFGPVMLGGLLGGRVEFQSDTTWTHAFINDEWSNAPDWTLREDQPWWQLLRQLSTRVAAEAPGRYLVCTPDLGGSSDVLLNLRGSSELCLDVLERPDFVRRHIDAIFPAWHRAFTEMYRLTVPGGAGLIHWHGLWSNRPYMIPACDFNFMIGPIEFDRVCLPDIARQAATVGRAVFHLDGPGAARHIDALLDVPALDAIQFTPGEGTPSALAWVEMFRKIQARGRSVLVHCPANEVLAICEALRPEGLAIQVTGNVTAEALDEVFASFVRRYET